jgi:ATP-dependent DNA helicase RecG
VRRSLPGTASGTSLLQQSVQFVKGVGPRRVSLFAKLGIETVADLIAHFPFRHQVQGAPQPINTLEEGEPATIVGRIVDVWSKGRRWSRYPTSVFADIEDDTGGCELRWFNAAYMADRLESLRRGLVRVHGEVRASRWRIQMVNPQIEPADHPSPAATPGGERLEPVYRAVDKLPSRAIATAVQACLPQAVKEIEELFDDAYLAARHLARRRSAVERYHHPKSLDDIPIARRRIAYDELFLMQLAIAMKRARALSMERAIPLPSSDEIDRRIRRRFPFPLTRAQDRAIREIVADLARARPMNRLLQGDVGSGKTVVALYAALVAIANKQQCAIMAPTEVLAEQHFRNVEKYLEGSQVRRVLLTGRTAARPRTQAIRATADGQMDLVIGTQALLEKDVGFRSLALVVVDEQHKFGVAQRGTIRARAAENVIPHYLVMSATPIPRTLSMTVFGDLDVSVIDELPPGRQKVRTMWMGPERYDDAWKLVRDRLGAGEQAFIVYPLVEESEAMPLRAATKEVDHIASEILPGIKVELLHGKMPGKRKQEVMQRFAGGETQVLVSTTVIEVGVDVPNATVMVIQHADHYGLAALHQLRGRVGRGDRPAYCLLLADQAGDVATRRLSILCETTDGFRIAEEDLRIRGPGEILGTQQHGWPELKVANLVTDADLLDLARRDALEMARRDPKLTDPRHAALRRELIARFRHRLAWIDVA